MKRFFALFCAVFCFALSVTPSFAITYDELPEFPVTEHPYQDTLTYIGGDGVTVFHTVLYSNAEFIDSVTVTTQDIPSGIKTPYAIRYNYLDNDYAIYNTIYRLTDGEWVNTGTYQQHNLTTYTGINEKSYVLGSSLDIYNDDGTLFFEQTPVVVPLEEIMKTEMPKFQETTVGTMKVLVLCGVGLIALLVVLNLFGKVFRIFQVK